MAALTPVAWMGSASIGSALLAIVAGAPALEVFSGMAGPLIAATVTWLLVWRTFRAAPEDVTGVLMKAFAGKMVFFAAFVVTMLSGLTLAATPFAVSFTAYFIGIYAMEAVFLQRLFVGTR
jgi:hypothetical protein